MSAYGNTNLTVGLDDYTAKKKKGIFSLSLSCFPVKISNHADMFFFNGFLFIYLLK